MMILRLFLFTGVLAIQFFIPTGLAKGDQDTALAPIIKEVSAKLGKNAARRTFRFKGMNDSLQFTSDALKLLRQPESQKAVPMSVWSSNSPLTAILPSAGLTEPQKKVLNLLAKARAAYPKNSFALAVKADVLKAAGETIQSRDTWEEYLSQSQDYSSFDREILSRSQFDSLRRYAEKFLRSQGLDFNEVEHQRLLLLPWYERICHFVIHPASGDQVLNQIFIGAILLGAFLFVVCSATGVEVYRSLGISLAVLYAAVWLSYGCWIYDRAYGLPWGVDRIKMVAAILGIACVMSFYEIWTAWRYANPRLEEGYRRCPHCKQIIVQLSVECEHCRKKIA